MFGFLSLMISQCDRIYKLYVFIPFDLKKNTERLFLGVFLSQQFSPELRPENSLNNLIVFLIKRRISQVITTPLHLHSSFLITHSIGRVVPGRSAAHRDAFGHQQTRTGRRDRSRFLPLGFLGGTGSSFLRSCLHSRLLSHHRHFPGSYLLRQFGSDCHRCFDIPVNILCLRFISRDSAVFVIM